MMRAMRCAMIAFVVLAGSLASRGEASVVIAGTRVIYPAQEREITVKLNNEGKQPSLLQAWLDRGDPQSTPSTVEVPFTIAPPIFRMDAGKGQALRIVYTKEPLPADKESLFWFNLLEIPPKDLSGEGRNMLQFAFRTRIKLFFRPAGLPGASSEAPDKLKWTLATDKDRRVVLKVDNPTAYYVNFADVGIGSGEHVWASEGSGGMVAPGESSTFVIKDLASLPTGETKAVFTVISDYGAQKKMERPVSTPTG